MSAVIRSHGIDSHNVDMVNPSVPMFDFLSGQGHIIDTDKVLDTESLDFERFINQDILIYLSEPTSEHEPAFVELNVNGDYRFGLRGGEMKIKRSHLAVLAQAKQSRVRQKKQVHADGSMGYTEEAVMQLTYPFQVITDPDPRRGGPWLRQLLSNNV